MYNLLSIIVDLTAQKIQAFLLSTKQTQGR
jgi:hypothetical protein